MLGAGSCFGGDTHSSISTFAAGQLLNCCEYLLGTGRLRPRLAAWVFIRVRPVAWPLAYFHLHASAVNDPETRGGEGLRVWKTQ